MRYSDTQMCQRCHHKYNVTHKSKREYVNLHDGTGEHLEDLIYCYECGKACDGKVKSVSIS